MKNRDLNIFFTKNTETEDISLVTGNAAIIQSIKNIILTTSTSIPYHEAQATYDLFMKDSSKAKKRKDKCETSRG